MCACVRLVWTLHEWKQCFFFYLALFSHFLRIPNSFLSQSFPFHRPTNISHAFSEQTKLTNLFRSPPVKRSQNIFTHHVFFLIHSVSNTLLYLNPLLSFKFAPRVRSQKEKSFNLIVIDQKFSSSSCSCTQDAVLKSIVNGKVSSPRYLSKNPAVLDLQEASVEVVKEMSGKIKAEKALQSQMHRSVEPCLSLTRWSTALLSTGEAFVRWNGVIMSSKRHGWRSPTCEKRSKEKQEGSIMVRPCPNCMADCVWLLLCAFVLIFSGLPQGKNGGCNKFVAVYLFCFVLKSSMTRS